MNLFIKIIATELGFIGAQKYSSHSCKAAMLTFASASGLSTETRAILGHHRVKGDSSAVRSYDRERITPEVKLLDKAIQRHKMSSADPEEVMADESSDSSSEEEVSAKPVADSRLLFNKLTKVVHRGRAGDGGKNACGKALQEHYDVVSLNNRKWENFRGHKCENCFRPHQEEVLQSSDSESASELEG